MYQVDIAQIRSRLPRAHKSGKLAWTRVADVSPTVWSLGFTSLFTDISSEMVSSILPVYFVLHLHFSPKEFGFLDGISQGATVALLSLASGVFADRWRRQKQVAVAGYALSAASRIALLAAGNMWALIASILALDRVGKGVRTAPRDAMISLTSSECDLATAFAVHRALDTCGAIFGPLTAFLLLRSFPSAFDMVLMASFCFAVLGLGVITLFVDRPSVITSKSPKTPTVSLSLELLKQRKLGVLVGIAGILGMVTVSDGFIYLLLQNTSGASASSIPLYAFLTGIFYMFFSVPAGRLADQWGRKRAFLAGYCVLGLIYALLLGPSIGARSQFIVVILFGAYYATTDGVVAAITSSAVPAELRTSGLALLNTATSLSRLASSILFGWLWASFTIKFALWTFLLSLCVALVLSTRIFSGATRN